MSVEEARKFALLKQEIPAADRSLHEQALVTLLTAYESQAAVLADCRDDISVAVCGEDGLDVDDGLNTIERISEVLGDKEDYDAQQKCADDPCDRCGEDGIRHLIKIGPAKYDGVCDACFSLSGRENTTQKANDSHA